jgi:methionine-gamma-lyase
MPTHTDLVHIPPRAPGDPIVPPVHTASIFTLTSTEHGAQLSKEVAPERFYGRWGNPTVAALEEAVAGAEGGEKALAFASGMAAMSAAVLASVRAGDRVVVPVELYGGTAELVRGFLPTLGVSHEVVSLHDDAALTAACDHDGRVLVVMETPSNPVLEIFDLARIAAVARAAGARTLCDNTWATPWCQNPLALGFDGVVHSATKAIGGHSDAVAGVVVGDAAWMAEVWKMRKLLGGCLSPREAAPVLRGLKTLGVRQERACDTAGQLAAWLQAHPAVRRVYYPGLADHPGHAVAARQMHAFGSMLAFELADLTVASRVAESVRVFSHAVSLGGVESLICHPASTTHAGLSEEALAAAGIAPGLLRVSVGLEEPQDLLSDLAQALSGGEDAAAPG